MDGGIYDPQSPSGATRNGDYAAEEEVDFDAQGPLGGDQVRSPNAPHFSVPAQRTRRS